MSFLDFPEQEQVVQLLQRSLERGRLGHAYLFNGPTLEDLEAVARTLAKTVNCQAPARRSEGGLAHDSCDACSSCRRIDSFLHPDVYWIRAESKLRVIMIEQIRNLLQSVYLKPMEAEYKVAIVVAADRLNVQAANAFLKTLEEPPARSILILLTTEPQRVLETILSRCLRLNFAGEKQRLDPAHLAWLSDFTRTAAAGQHGLMDRYRLLGVLLKKLAGQKEEIEKSLGARSPLERYDDADPRLREKWEGELSASIEAEYRRQRADLLLGLQWWLRDVWLRTQHFADEMLSFPDLLNATEAVARRIPPTAALENLGILETTQRLLYTNVQEALTLEVGLLKLKL